VRAYSVDERHSIAIAPPRLVGAPLLEARTMHTKTLVVEPALLPALQPLGRALSNYAWSYEPALMSLRAAFAQKVLAFGVTLSDRQAPFSALLQLKANEQERLATDAELQALTKSALAVLDKPVSYDLGKNALVAYFSAEYGVHEALPIYAGGLGILAGDHLKSASDLGLPLVAVGLFYRLGYHEQTIGSDRAVHERYIENDPMALGATLCKHDNGEPVLVHVQLPGRHCYIQAWEVRIGRTPLLLLDTNVVQNNENDRKITEKLYGGDHHCRIEQELVLGVGGTFMLEALGKKPTVYHMNEGHAAFLTYARLHMAQRDFGLALEDAHELVAASNVFTTHTPIAAGNDVFSHGILMPYLQPLCESLGLPLSFIQELGNDRVGHVDSHPETPYSMTAFALRSAEHRNGVSLEHGDVSRRLWHPLWPALTHKEIPIGAIVNGVHMPTWSDVRMQRHFKGSSTDHAAFFADKRVLRKELVDRVNATRPVDRHFSADVLTLGFARRFAEYKRALLLFSDPARLRRFLGNDKRPVQLVFAGKAHPNNLREKANIKALHELIEQYDLGASVAFVESYDMSVARALVRGVDVWLNLPRPPLEASGTSGMKIVENGGLNVSVRDGWWKEAYAPGLGFAVGELHDDTVPFDDASRDALDALDLYRVLENEVAPLFYTRNAAGLPIGWIDTCVASAKALACHFGAARMVDAYAQNFYAKGSAAWSQLTQENGADLRSRVQRQRRILQAVSQARVEWREGPKLSSSRKIAVKAHVLAPGLEAQDFVVDLIVGRALSVNAPPYAWQNVVVQPMTLTKSEDGTYSASAEVDAQSVGSQQVALRLLPRLDSSRMIPAAVFA
jgi:glycogen phosphorylase